MKNVSSVAEPMYRLLRKGERWLWTKQCSKAFKETKHLLANSHALTYYDAHKPLGLQCDASAYGVGAVIFHVLPEGEERPIAFASRTLTSAEKNYAQCEREALALIFGLKKFHKFLFGRKFILYTDHQPLVSILGQNKATPSQAASKLQRWSLIMSAYQYTLKYRKGTEIEVANALSRLPVPSCPKSEGAECLSVFESTPLNSSDVAKATARDGKLCRVVEYTRYGWPSEVPNELEPYYVTRLELPLEQGCVTWGTRVIVPEALQSAVLSLLHEDHPGTSRMKMLARGFIWWPGLDKAVEDYVRTCRVCQVVQPAMQPVPLHPWPYPSKVWQRLHVDFAMKGQFNFLVLVDAYSKWVEVWLMNSTTTSQMVSKLRNVFAAYGFPDEIVSDNGPQFVSQEFEHFLAKNNIKHTRTPPYHPISNGAAERLVQTTKRALLKQLLSDVAQNRESVQTGLDSFLMSYRNTPHSVTGSTPAQLFLKRQPKTKLSFLKPDFQQDMFNKQLNNMWQKDKHRGTERGFLVGDKVCGENVAWTDGIVAQIVSPVTYLVNVAGEVRFVHADHLRHSFARPVSAESLQLLPDRMRLAEPQQPPDTDPVVTPTGLPTTTAQPMESALRNTMQSPTSRASTDSPTTAPTTTSHQDTSPAEQSTEVPSKPEAMLRRSGRARRPPDRFGYEDLRK